jgi:endonuclease/exonuclease/phosphatase family metal-dependent hydrolase
MGRYKHWLGILIACVGCDAVDDDPAPVWTPWDQIEGKFRPELQQPLTVAPVAKTGLRLVSYNVLYGVDVDEDATFFLADPDLANADVICLQETRRQSFEVISDTGQLAERMNMGYVFVPNFEEDGDLYGIAMLSRHPLEDVEVMLLPELVETAPEDRAARAALRARVETDAGSIHIINVHLDVALNVPERILQVRPAVIDPPASAAVLGDFNTNDYVWAFDTIPVFPIDAVADTSQATALDGYMRDIDYATPTEDFGDTWHGPPKDQRLDSIFTHGLSTGRGAVAEKLDTSDHRPIWLDVSVQR